MDLTFHILDISSRDEIVISDDEQMRAVEYESGHETDDEKPKAWTTNPNGRIVIHIFGSTADGKNVRIDCKGFEPFFYLRTDKKNIQVIHDYIKKSLKNDELNKLVKLTHVSRKLLYGYTGGTEFSFIEVRVPSEALFRSVKKLFLNDKSEPATRFPLKGIKPSELRVYEANLDSSLRFMHLRNLKPCSWCTVTGGKAIADTSSGCYIIDECDWEDVNPAQIDSVAPFKLVSWDIECWSKTGDFPVAERGDPIIQIGTVLTSLGSKETERHIFVLGTCDEINGITVHSYKKEKDMIRGWFDWLSKQNIDIMIGYNIFGFDEQYVWNRCKELNLTQHESVQQMNRLCEYGGEMRLDQKRLSSSAMGDNLLQLWNTNGRLRIDLYHAIKRQYPMSSYKLDDTSKAFLNDPVLGTAVDGERWTITCKEEGIIRQGACAGRAIAILNENGESLCEKCPILSMTQNTITFQEPIDVDKEDIVKWAIVKDDVSPQEMFKMHCGSSADRALIAAYCIQDCQLVLDMFKKLDTFNNAMSMANVCSVPVSHIFLRGQGIKIESLIFKYCHENNLCIEVMPSKKFGSTEEDAEQESYEGAIVLDPVPGFYKVPVGVADFASLYPSTIISENISHDTLVSVTDYSIDGKTSHISWGEEFSKYNTPDTVPFTDIEFDIWGVKEGDTRKNPDKEKKGIRICRYAQDKQGAIPIIIAQLLDARKKTRALIKTEVDPFRKALLDSQQNAYKITANSLYGQLGSGVFKIRMQALAASTTAYGRKQIMFAKGMIEEFYPSCTTVYGDTDSLFICFNPKDASGKPLEGHASLVETIRLTNEAGKLVTQALKAPHDFEFDKVYWPFLIFSKKRYVGHKYEEEDHYVQTSMGIALKRRDYAPIVKKVYGGAIHILLTEKNVAKAAEFVQRTSKELIEGKVGLGPLTVTKSLKSQYANPKSIAHKVLADRIAERDPGNAPASGDRIGYIYVQPQAGQIAADLQGERIETPAYIREKGLKPDYMFYIDHQISNPVCQVFGLLVEDVPGYVPQSWDEDPIKESKQREDLAYKLLFNDAVNANNINAKRKFLSLFGVENKESAKPSSKVHSRIVTVSTTPAKKQSKLDIAFIDQVKSNAYKKAKAEEKEKEKTKLQNEGSKKVLNSKTI